MGLKRELLVIYHLMKISEKKLNEKLIILQKANVTCLNLTM